MTNADYELLARFFGSTTASLERLESHLRQLEFEDLRHFFLSCVVHLTQIHDPDDWHGTQQRFAEELERHAERVRARRASE